VIDAENPTLSVSRQCELLGVSRSSYYYVSKEDTASDLELKAMIDKQFTDYPFYGSRRMTAWLCSVGCLVNRKRIQRLMREMGIEAIYPKPNLSKRDNEHKIYPYLLRGVEAEFPNHIWSRYYVYKARRRICVLYSYSGLVQSICDGLASV
jgi:putative transposase